MDGANTAVPQKDWVELYNNTNKRIDLTGYGLSDASDRPFRMKLANVSIAPKSTVVITPRTFAVSAQGETIMLTDPSGVVEDTFATGHLRVGSSSGRQIGASSAGSLNRVFYMKPTKGRANTATAYRGYTGVPTISASRRPAERSWTACTSQRPFGDDPDDAAGRQDLLHAERQDADQGVGCLRWADPRRPLPGREGHRHPSGIPGERLRSAGPCSRRRRIRCRSSVSPAIRPLWSAPTGS